MFSCYFLFHFSTFSSFIALIGIDLQPASCVIVLSLKTRKFYLHLSRMHKHQSRCNGLEATD